jgi:hypothetical protein
VAASSPSTESTVTCTGPELTTTAAESIARASKAMSPTAVGTHVKV